MPVEQGFDVYAGDGWSIGLPCFNMLTGLPQDLTTYGAFFSMRANFGDPSPLISCTSSASSPNGSTISILPYTGTPGTGTVCVITPNIRAADTTAAAAISINTGAKMSRLWGQIGILPPGGADPVTLFLPVWYLRQRV